MRGFGQWCTALVAGLALFAVSAAQASSERRVALVLGNSAYSKITALTNPRNDAADVATRLRDLGFEVMERSDFDRNSINDVLRDYSRMVVGADVAMIYYAGHALEHGEDYYLVPVDSAIDDSDALAYETLPASRLDEILARVPGVRITVFDACRRDMTRDQANAMSAMGARQTPIGRPARGDVKIFATAPLDVAEDGRARNSPFTRALLRHLNEPELGVRKLFRHVARDVLAETKGRQQPEVKISLDGDFAFNRSETDLTRWATIRHSSDPEDFRDFLARFPRSTYRADAQFRLDVLVRISRRIEERRASEARRLEAEQQALEAAEREKNRLAEEEERRKLQEAARIAEQERRRAEEEERRAAQRRTCEAERALVESKSSSREALQRLRRDAKCFETSDLVLSALAQIDTREAAEREHKRLADEAERQKQQEAVRIAEQERRRAEEEERRAALQRTCETEKAQVESKSSSREALQRFRRDAKCPETSNLVTSALAQVDAREAAEREKKRLIEEAERRKQQEAALIAEQERQTCEAEKSQVEAKSSSREALQRLRRDAECPATSNLVLSALAQIEAREAQADRRKRQDMCKKEGAQVDDLSRAGDAEKLNSLRGLGLCPDTPKRVDQALASIAEKAEQERQRLEREAKAREEVCRTEFAQIERLALLNNRDAVAAVKASGRCPDTASRADLELAAIDQRQKELERLQREANDREATCAGEASQIEDLARQGHADQLGDLRGAAKCVDTARRIDGALAALAERNESERQRLLQEVSRREEVCRAEAADIAGLTKLGGRADLLALRNRAECGASADRIEAALARIEQMEADQTRVARAEVCRREAAAIAELVRAGRQPALTEFKTKAQCPDSGERIAGALMEVAKLDEQALCRGESAQIAAFAREQRKVDLFDLKSTARCAASAQEIDKVLAEIARRESALAAVERAESDRRTEICRAEATKLEALGLNAEARSAVAAFRSDAHCDATRKLADDALQTIDEARRMANACAGDQSKFEALRSQGVDGRTGLDALLKTTACPDMKPRVLAALEQPGPVPVALDGQSPPSQTVSPELPADAVQANSPAQIERSQQLLKTLGCYVGPIDQTKVEDAKDALENFLKVKGEDPGELDIDDALIGRLEEEPQKRVCPLECDDDEVARGDRCVPAPNRNATPRREAPAISREDRRQKQREERRAREEQREERRAKEQREERRGREERREERRAREERSPPRQTRPARDVRPERPRPPASAGASQEPPPRRAMPVAAAKEPPAPKKPGSLGVMILGN